MIVDAVLPLLCLWDANFHYAVLGWTSLLQELAVCFGRTRGLRRCMIEELHDTFRQLVGEHVEAHHRKFAAIPEPSKWFPIDVTGVSWVLVVFCML